MNSSKDFPPSIYSDVECEMCGDPIPWKRLKIINTQTCVGCMEDLEAQGKGTQKHKLTYHFQSDGEDVELVDMSIERRKAQVY